MIKRAVYFSWWPNYRLCLHLFRTDMLLDFCEALFHEKDFSVIFIAMQAQPLVFKNSQIKEHLQGCVVYYKRRESLINRIFRFILFFSQLFDSISMSWLLTYAHFIEVDGDGTQLDTTCYNSISLDVISSYPPSNNWPPLATVNTETWRYLFRLMGNDEALDIPF